MPVDLERKVDLLRFVYLQTYFSTLNRDAEDDSDNETVAESQDTAVAADNHYEHSCNMCGEITFYSDMPSRDYPFNYCLSRACLRLQIQSREFFCD